MPPNCALKRLFKRNAWSLEPIFARPPRQNPSPSGPRPIELDLLRQPHGRQTADDFGHRPSEIFLHLIFSFLQNYGYLGLAGLALLSAGFVPLPGGLVAAAAGGLVAIKLFDPLQAWAALAAGGSVGDLGRYWVSRKFMSEVEWDRHDERYQGLRRVDRLLKKHAFSTIVASRFVPFAKGAVDSLSGMSRLGVGSFVPADIIGNVTYAATFLALGYFFGQSWGDAKMAVTLISLIAFLLGGATVLSVLIFPRLTEARRHLGR